VAINCGALAPTLVESQLFGHLKGAFSGAQKDEPGLVRASSGGTLFLDEIGELPAAAQATLLRVLQEKEVLPLGATKPVPVDLRVVAATLKPIEQSPSFRPDLYARVAAYVHRLVPLRERRADLGLLIADLLPRLAAERAPKLRFSPDLATALVSHAWPLNVRELEHLLSVAIVTSTEDLLRTEHVGDALRRARPSSPTTSASMPAATPTSATPPSAPTPRSAPAASRPLSEDDARLRAELSAELTRTHGNVSEVARTMGKTRMQIHRWMKRFGIAPESFRA
jgi:DNA-binding NtrC family response regulator